MTNQGRTIVALCIVVLVLLSMMFFHNDPVITVEKMEGMSMTFYAGAFQEEENFIRVAVYEDGQVMKIWVREFHDIDELYMHIKEMSVDALLLIEHLKRRE